MNLMMTLTRYQSLVIMTITVVTMDMALMTPWIIRERKYYSWALADEVFASVCKLLSHLPFNLCISCGLMHFILLS